MATLFTTTGAVIRWNIVHVDNYLADRPFHDPVMWAARITQVVFAGGYAVSVAYYLKLLADVTMKPLTVPEVWHVLILNIGVTAIIGVLMMLAFSGGLKRVEHVAHGTVSIKIDIIAGLLAGLGCWWAMNIGTTPSIRPPRCLGKACPCCSAF